MGFWDSSGISWIICKQAAPRSRQTTTPTPHHSIFYRPDALPDTQPTVSKQCRVCETITSNFMKQHQCVTEEIHCTQGRKFISCEARPVLLTTNWSAATKVLNITSSCSLPIAKGCIAAATWRIKLSILARHQYSLYFSMGWEIFPIKTAPFLNPLGIGADFHRATVVTVPGEKLLIGRCRPVRNWTHHTIPSLFLCRKLHLFLGKSTNTAATRAALFDSTHTHTPV